MSTTDSKATKTSPAKEEGTTTAAPDDIIRLQRSRDGKRLDIVNPTPEILKALKNIGENNPAILLDWDFDMVAQGVTWANAHANQPGFPALPAWYPVAHHGGGALGAGYPITVVGIQEGLASVLAESGSGKWLGRCLLAPNSLEEYSRIRDRMCDMMWADPFLLAMYRGNRCPLARVYVLADPKAKTMGMHIPLLAVPQGGVQVFS